MRRSWPIGLAWLLIWTLVLGAAPPVQAGPAAIDHESISPAAPANGQIAGEVIPGRYIVTLRDDAIASQAVADLTRGLGVSPTLEFDDVLAGFAAELTPAQAAALAESPRVLLVEPDIWFGAHDVLLPTGVDRIGADQTVSGVAPLQPGKPVAVLDTGIANHPDLTVAGGYNCTSGDRAAFDDRDGHGTHVAGTIGARGRIAGVAPGTPIWGVKVLNDNGAGRLSWLICGHNWVAANHERHGIVAINLSLGAPDTRDEHAADCASASLHRAICQAKKQGLTVVVSAGNSNRNADTEVPAKYNQVITVAAMTDTDGCAGGRGGPSSWGSRDPDDHKWIHSNFGAAVDVIAPGVDIRSTVPGGYAQYSGTSMAAPHVTGAIALGWNPRTGPRDRGIAGFQSDLGLVQLSGNVGCLGDPPMEITADPPAKQRSAKPTITVTPKQAAAGDRVRVKLRGYHAKSQVRVLLNGKRVDLVAVSASGAGTARVRVPGDAKAKRYVVRGGSAPAASRTPPACGSNPRQSAAERGGAPLVRGHACRNLVASATVVSRARYTARQPTAPPR